MTLKEAFNQWSVAPRNSVLANRSRDAVNKVLLKEYGDTDLELIDETFAREIFLGSDVAQELKTKAASILVYVLQWGGDHGHCDRPSFDFSVARKPEVQPADKPKGRKKPQISQKDTESLTPNPSPTGEGKSLTPNPSPTGEGNAAAPIKKATSAKPNASGDQAAASLPKGEGQGGASAKPNASGDQAAASLPTGEGQGGARIIRKVDDDICQLDLRTLEVIKRWPHAHRIMQELGIGNVVRAIGRCGIAGGFYWSYSKDLDTFAARLADRKEHNAEVHKNHCAQMREKKSLTPNPSPTGEGNQARSKVKATSAKPNASGDQAAASLPTGEGQGGASAKPKASVKPAAVCDNKKSPCESVSSVATPSLRGMAGKGLSGFTDDELFAELDRRGWFGYFSRTEIVTIGNK